MQSMRRIRSGANLILDEVYLPKQEEEDELLPLVGVADSEQPVIERPVAPQPPQDAAAGEGEDEDEENRAADNSPQRPDAAAETSADETDS